MNASEYQQLAARTLLDSPDHDVPDLGLMLVWNALGLAGEAGEVAEHIKKGVLHRHGIDRNQLQKELGDVLWYVAALCTKTGIDLGEVMQDNINKLRRRYPDGYSSKDSQRRIDTVGSIEGVRVYVDKAFDSQIEAMKPAYISYCRVCGGMTSACTDRPQIAREVSKFIQECVGAGMVVLHKTAADVWAAQCCQCDEQKDVQP